MNTKGTKFLAVLAVLAMAFAAVAVIGDYDPIAGEGDDNKVTLSGVLEKSQVLTTNAIVASDGFEIPEGLTLTVASGTLLELADNEIIVKGSLVVENRGEIAGDGDITIYKTAVLDLKGFIAKTGTITFAASNETDESPNTAVGEVEVTGVQGISFAVINVTTSADKVETLAISGTVNIIGGLDAGVSKTIVATNACINGDLTIGKGVTATFNNVTVMKDVKLENKGAVATDSIIILECGASYVANDAKNATAVDYTLTIKAYSGYIASEKRIVADESKIEEGSDVVNEYVYLTVTSMKDYMVTVKKFSVIGEVDDEKSYKYQSMFISGIATVNGGDEPAIGYKDKATRVNGENNSFLFVDGTFEVPSKAEITAMSLNVEKAGLLIRDALAEGVADAEIEYIGASYQMENLDEELDTYYTTFADAFATIDLAEDMTVEIAGTMEINNSYTILADQTVNEKTGSAITIGKAAVITVENDGVFNALQVAADKIEGKVIVKEFGSCTPAEGTYAVSKIDEATYTYIYSGLAVALDEAQAGDVIDVVTETTVEESLTVKEGVTLNLKDDVTVEGSLYIKEGAIVNVEKTLTVGDAEKDSKIDVQGKLDATKGTLKGEPNAAAEPDVNVALYSTGVTIVKSTFVPADANIDVNAATYKDDYIYYTTVAGAISEAKAADLDAIEVLGDVTEKGAIEAKEVNILVSGTFSFETLNLEDANISCATPVTDKIYYSGKVTGLNGVGDAAAKTAISVDKMQSTIAAKTTENYEEVNEYKMTIDGITGKVIIESGVVSTGADITIDGETYEYDKNMFVVKSGAEFIVTKDVTLTIVGNNIETIIDGKMTIDEGKVVFGPAEVDKYPVLAGEIFITNGGSLTASCLQIIGAVVADSEDDSNEFIIENGGVVLGQTTKDTNAINAQIVGKTTIGATSYIISSATADLSKADFNEDVVMTTYFVNGAPAVKAVANKETFPIWAPTDAAVYGYVFEYFLEPIGGLAWPDIDEIDWVDANDKVVNTKMIGDVETVSAEIKISMGKIYVSTIEGVQLFIDGVNVYYGIATTLYVGDHVVTAKLAPGYEGEFTIFFDGVVVENGGIIKITDDMTAADNVLSVAGDITIEKDKGMSITEILLIVLVVLIAIMAVIVALRLNRS